VWCVTTNTYLLLSEVAELARVSIDTVRFWVRAGKLASVRPGRRRMVRREVLEAFLLRDAAVERRASCDVQ
jgi:excisionase family DNA binding protein